MASCNLHPNQRASGSRCKRTDCDACAAAGAPEKPPAMRPSDPTARTSMSQLYREVREEFANEEAARRRFVEQASVQILCSQDAYDGDAPFLAAQAAIELWARINEALRGISE